MKTWEDLRIYERDLFTAVARAHVKKGSPPHGTRVFEELNQFRGETGDIDVDRAYQALRDLSDRGLLCIGEAMTDNRSNLYLVTTQGRELLKAQRERYDAVLRAEADAIAPIWLASPEAEEGEPPLPAEQDTHSEAVADE